MADVIKIATRESYGEALKEIAAECDKLVVLDADLADLLELLASLCFNSDALVVAHLTALCGHVNEL